MASQRLDVEMARRKLVGSRSQAESFIRMGKVIVDGKLAVKSGQNVSLVSKIELQLEGKYVSRAGFKLASVAGSLNVDFVGKIVLDVGSSTGGFTDYALQHGAKKVYAVDVGTDQIHESLRSDPRIELHEKTDIRDFVPASKPDIVVIDVSFISLREVLPAIFHLLNSNSQIIAMVKPQFEAGQAQVSRGVIKNDTIRRQILKDFEVWSKGLFVIVYKADSEIAGSRGNRERFYKLRIQKANA